MVQISIVIPVYNIEKYIGICLDSLLNQTFNDYEIICVNDGSKDKSLDILRQYAEKDKRISVITQPNGGSGSARNRGLKEAKGKYVQFLDGDDYFEPQMLETLFNLAESVNSDIAVCSSRKVDDFGNITESRNPNSPLNMAKTPINRVFSYKDFPDDIFGLTGSMPWNKLYLREMLTENNLAFPNLTGPDDLCFVQMANVCAKKIIVTDEELINYRFNRAGSVQTYRADHTIDIIKAWLYIKDFLIKRSLYEELSAAFKKSMISTARQEISLCNEEQYNKFLSEIKNLLPNDWQEITSTIRHDYITSDYLESFIGNKKTILWGASIFIQKVLSKGQKIPNVIGFVDGNKALHGKMCGEYKVFSPDEIKKINPDAILVTALSVHETLHEELKKKDFGNKLLPDIFVN